MRKGSTKGNKLTLEFHQTYYIMALGFVLTGYYLNLFVFTSLILIHELGHFLVATIFHFHVEKIIIYPYGGLTKIEDLINQDINEELLIATAGVLMQFLFYLGIVFLHKQGFIRDYTMNLYTLYNHQMIFFNLLPIYPLDGSKIINLLLSKFFNYYFSNNMTIMISFATIVLIVGCNVYYCNYSNLMIMGLLLRYLWDFFQKRKFLYQRFLLERYLYTFHYPKIKIIQNKKKMYKNRSHLFCTGKSFIEEKEYLKHIFSE